MNSETHKLSTLQAKLSIGFVALTIVTCALLTSALYLAARDCLHQDIRNRLRDVVSIAALQVDADAHSTLTDPDEEGNATYTQIQRTLQEIHDAGMLIHFVYTMRQDAEGRIVFVVDAETDPEEIAHLGDVYDDASPMLVANFATLTHAIVEEDFYTDKWGTWLTGYAPFSNSDGHREGVLGIDIAATTVLSHKRQLLWVALAIFGAMVPLISILGWLIGRRLATPIIALTTGAERIAEGDLSYKISVRSNDEMGRLATAFNNMTHHLGQSLGSLKVEVAEHKRAEEELKKYHENLENLVKERTSALRKSEEKYHSLVEHSLDAVYITARQGEIIDINPAGLELFGYTREEMVGKNVAMLCVDIHDRDEFQRIIEQSGSVTDYEVQFRRKDGTKLGCLVTSTVRRDSSGVVLGYQGIIRDITERKKAEETLQAEHRRLADIIEFLPDATFVVDRDRKVVAWNRAIEQMTGVRKKDALGKGNDV